MVESSPILSYSDEASSVNFNKLILNAKVPVIINFWATWSQPCHVMVSLTNRLAKEFEDLIQVYEIDIEQNTALAEYFNIINPPTLFFIANQTIHKRSHDIMDYKELVQHTQALIKMTKKES